MVITAIFATPLALLTLLVSTTTWQPMIFGPESSLFVTLPVGLLVGGIATCSLLPYAAARWTRLGLFPATASWIAGILVTAACVTAVLPLLYQPLKEGGLLMSPELRATARAFHYADWLTFNGLMHPVAHFSYEGTLDFDVCAPSPSSSWTIHIPNESRATVEHFLFGENFTEKIRNWFATPSIKPGEECQTETIEGSDGSVTVTEKCTMSEHFQIYALKYATILPGFDTTLPMVRFQAPELVPDRSSILTITAPQGCIAETFPPATRFISDGKKETLKLPVGFPRESFSLFDAHRIVEDPINVHVDFIYHAFRGNFLGSTFQTMNNWPGMAALFILFAVTTGVFLRKVRNTLTINQYTAPMLDFFSFVVGLPFRPLVRASAWYRRRTRLTRWVIITVAALTISAFTFATLAPVVFAILIEPPYWVATALFFSNLLGIEIVAFLIRFASRKIGVPKTLDT
ncbi:hypothetical protein [Rhizobium ruizarguesonis]|uniref:hypothetical protein n=1 Tax=Rhizobium ruizarguesonis TaxID=2081791 RepID=UPI001030E716|nr:hypothetical protein [Rhizobium ruizarguesonis]TBA72911.1 hypothetical protein ELH56_35230 [Rhizobium ruizarguesonis]WSH62390.1 hypothetical protein U8P68_38040 [Rhizobium ruizarguesonis]